jgi:hypothetical protein
MNDLTTASEEMTLTQLQREKNILDILRLMLWEKDEKGKTYSITRACQEVGIDRSTWHRWMQDGLISGPLQRIAEEMNQAVYDTVVPYHREIMETLVNMARGIGPEGMEMKPADVLAAIREYMKIVPTRPLDQEAGNDKSEFEHLDTFQPKQVFVNVEAGDFIYQGNSSIPPPELESGEEDIIDLPDTE